MEWGGGNMGSACVVQTDHNKLFNAQMTVQLHSVSSLASHSTSHTPAGLHSPPSARRPLLVAPAPRAYLFLSFFLIAPAVSLLQHPPPFIRFTPPVPAVACSPPSACRPLLAAPAVFSRHITPFLSCGIPPMPAIVRSPPPAHHPWLLALAECSLYNNPFPLIYSYPPTCACRAAFASLCASPFARCSCSLWYMAVRSASIVC